MSATPKLSQSGCLLDMPSGCKLRVDELTGNASERSRLYSLGILPGTELEVCQPAEGSGNVCVRVRECSLVLGSGMAEGIRCRPSGDNNTCRRAGRFSHPSCCCHGPEGLLRHR